MEEGSRVRLTEVNPYLVCVLCQGYLVDATTIPECLHSFCRSCIIRQLEKKSMCPICETQIHSGKIYKCLRPDKTLQDIVYKLVPGLFHSEMQRRRDFYKNHPHRDEHLEPECRGVGLDRLIYCPDDLISLSLEFYDEECEKEEWSNQGSPKPAQTAPSGPKRYLQCPAGFKMAHLKKFLRLKYGLSPSCNIEIVYKRETLPDSYSLMDVAYIYTWKRNSPMRFYYKIPESVLMQLLAPIASSDVSSAQEMTSGKPEPSSETVEGNSKARSESPQESENKENENGLHVSATPSEVTDDKDKPKSEKKDEPRCEKLLSPIDDNGSKQNKQQESSAGASPSRAGEHNFLIPAVPNKNGIVEKKNVKPRQSLNKIASDLIEQKTLELQSDKKNSASAVAAAQQQLLQKQKPLLPKTTQYQKQKELKQQQLQLKQEQLQKQKEQIQQIIQQQQLQHQLEQQQLQEFHQQQLQQLRSQQQLQNRQNIQVAVQQPVAQPNTMIPQIVQVPHPVQISQQQQGLIQQQQGLIQQQQQIFIQPQHLQVPQIQTLQVPQVQALHIQTPQSLQAQQKVAQQQTKSQQPKNQQIPQAPLPQTVQISIPQPQTVQVSVPQSQALTVPHQNPQTATTAAHSTPTEQSQGTQAASPQNQIVKVPVPQLQTTKSPQVQKTKQVSKQSQDKPQMPNLQNSNGPQLKIPKQTKQPLILPKPSSPHPTKQAQRQHQLPMRSPQHSSQITFQLSQPQPQRSPQNQKAASQKGLSEILGLSNENFTEKSVSSSPNVPSFPSPQEQAVNKASSNGNEKAVFNVPSPRSTPSPRTVSQTPPPHPSQRPTPPPRMTPPPPRVTPPPLKTKTPPLSLSPLPTVPTIASGRKEEAAQGKKESTEAVTTLSNPKLAAPQFQSANRNLMSGGNLNLPKTTSSEKSPVSMTLLSGGTVQQKKSSNEQYIDLGKIGNNGDVNVTKEVTVSVGTGSLTIMARPKVSPEIKTAEVPKPQAIHQNLPRTILSSPLVNGKIYPKAVPQKNISGQRLNNNLPALKSGQVALNKSPSSGKKGANPPGLKNGQTLDQRIQQLYNAGQANKPASPKEGGKSESRLANWLNNRFKSSPKEKSEENGKVTPPGAVTGLEEEKSEVSLVRYKRKLEEKCEITQENPRPEVEPKRRREEAPDVSIQLMRASDMKKLESSVAGALGQKKEKRPVPGLKSISEVAGGKRRKEAGPGSGEETGKVLDLSGPLAKSPSPHQTQQARLPWLQARPPHYIPRPT